MQFFMNRMMVTGTLVALVLGLAASAHALCVGDCAGTGSVGIPQVTKCARIFRLLDPPSDCVACDRNLDGSVSIADVQSAALSFRFPGACPMVNPTLTPTAGVPASTATSTETPTQHTAPTGTPTEVPTDTPTEAVATVTPTPTSTLAPTETPTQGQEPTETPTMEPAGECGNGFLEDGEDCDACPQDCEIQSCTSPGQPIQRPQVDFAGPPTGDDVAGITVLLGYQSDKVSIPGSGGIASVSQRVQNKPANTLVTVNDLDYALRVVTSKAGAIPPGRLFTVGFDSCLGAPTLGPADFGCIVEGCANQFGSLDGCTCAVVFP